MRGHAIRAAGCGGVSTQSGMVGYRPGPGTTHDRPRAGPLHHRQEERDHRRRIRRRFPASHCVAGDGWRALFAEPGAVWRVREDAG